jgi:hypothetical protein
MRRETGPKPSIMRRAAPLAAIMLLLLAVACGTKARDRGNAQGAANLQAAAVSIEIYGMAHNTYAGATLAALRSIDRSIKDISIVKASKTGFCIETTTGDPHIFLNPSAGQLMLGSCDDPENGKPYTPPPAKPDGEGDSLIASDPLRYSVPAIEAYRQDHGTYAGMSLGTLRYIDPGIPDISIVRAGKRTYCIEALAGESRTFKNGPTGEVLRGSCADPKSGKPFSSPPSEEPSPSSEPVDAVSALRASIPAIEAYWQDHTSYAGMTVSGLREKIDAGLPDIKIVSAKKRTYCIEIAVNSVSSFAQGPMGEIKQGHCPA